jgi:hypothetical protein
MTHSTPDDDTKPTISENTPLLGTSADEPIVPVNDGAILNHESHENGSTGPEGDHEKPLPKFQIFILCYARLIEPVAFFGIFPFISKMIYETGNLKKADVGFYAGFIVRPPSPPSPPELTLFTKIDIRNQCSHSRKCC